MWDSSGNGNANQTENCLSSAKKTAQESFFLLFGLFFHDVGNGDIHLGGNILVFVDEFEGASFHAFLDDAFVVDAREEKHFGLACFIAEMPLSVSNPLIPGRS
jgi:hypothetical protein